MEMIVHEMESGNTETYENLPHASAKKTGENNEGTPAECGKCTGRKFYILVAVSFGLLCLLQATLNISLRLILNSCSSMESLTEERDQLQASYNTLTRERDQLQASYNTLTGERDQLRTEFNNIDRHTLQGWVYFSHSLYFVSSDKKTWEDSRQDCLRRNADLVIINSRQEQEFTMRLKQQYWIGLTDTETEGTWKWVDGTPMTTSYWGDREPNSYEGRNEDCGEVRFSTWEKSWNDEPCKNQNVWICEKTAAVSSSMKTEERDQLRASYNNLKRERDQLRTELNNIDQQTLQGWVYFSHSLYFVSSDKKTWEDSRQDCLRRNADLMIINSRQEQEFTMRFGQRYWIGLTDRQTEGTWKWVDGTPMTTSYWGNGEPNSNAGTNEDCGRNLCSEDVVGQVTND
ncbi:C-type mannose receptor 2-like [Polymixia lowei]